MGESERQAGDGGERETSGRWGKRRDKRMMGKSKRHANDGEEQVMGKSERDRQGMEKSKRQASD
jgi:hypothetical protein